MKHKLQLIPLLLLVTLAPSHPAAAATKPVRVFILAGQSNMEGHGFVPADPKRNGGKVSLEFVTKDPATAKHFAPLVDAAGQWRARDDVWISYLDRNGPLTVGYGARREMIGPEPGFGWVMGDALGEPVLLIKCAWGGKSLAVDFRPPSAGKPPYSLGQKDDAAIAQDPAIIGKFIGEAMGQAMKQLQGAEATSLAEAEVDRVSARPELTITTIGFGSCARQERPQPIWDTINAARCDAFVLLGDNIYADTTDPTVFREKYALLAAMPGFAKLRQTTPLLATWDDHDFGINDGGAGFPGATVAQKEFCEFFQVPATSPLRNTPGVYDCVTLGPTGKRVQVILLDTRMFRSPLKKDAANPKVNIPNTDPDATVLGERQWAWFERRLREPAEVRVVVSSIQLIANEHGSEKWDNFPRERARFLELLSRTQAKGVVVISGDRHMAELSALTPADGVLYPLYDLTTSGLNQPIAKESEQKAKNPPKPQPNRYRLHERPYTGSNFGLMRIQWDGPHPSLRLEVCGLKGDVVISRDIPLAELRPK